MVAASVPAADVDADEVVVDVEDTSKQTNTMGDKYPHNNFRHKEENQPVSMATDHPPTL